MSRFNEYREMKLHDPEFKREYDALESEFDIIQAMIDARKQSGLTQKELAELKMERPIPPSGRCGGWRTAWG